MHPVKGTRPTLKQAQDRINIYAKPITSKRLVKSDYLTCYYKSDLLGPNTSSAWERGVFSFVCPSSDSPPNKHSMNKHNQSAMQLAYLLLVLFVVPVATQVKKILFQI